MNENLSTAIALLSLVAAFAGLVVWVRRDTFARRSPTPDHDTVVVDTPSAAPTRVAANPIPGRRTRVLQVTSR